MPRNAEAWSCSKQYTFLTNLPALALLCFIPDPRSDGKFNITAAANDARRYIRNVCTKSDRSACCRYIDRKAIQLQLHCEIAILATATLTYARLSNFSTFDLKVRNSFCLTVEAETFIIK